MKLFEYMSRSHDLQFTQERNQSNVSAHEGLRVHHCHAMRSLATKMQSSCERVKIESKVIIVAIDVLVSPAHENITSQLVQRSLHQKTLQR